MTAPRGKLSDRAKVRFASARTDADLATCLALTDAAAAVELRLSATEALVAIARDRASVEALVAAVGGF